MKIMEWQPIIQEHIVMEPGFEPRPSHTVPKVPQFEPPLLQNHLQMGPLFVLQQPNKSLKLHFKKSNSQDCRAIARGQKNSSLFPSDLMTFNCFSTWTLITRFYQSSFPDFLLRFHFRTYNSFQNVLLLKFFQKWFFLRLCQKFQFPTFSTWAKCHFEPCGCYSKRYL